MFHVMSCDGEECLNIICIGDCLGEVLVVVLVYFD